MSSRYLILLSFTICFTFSSFSQITNTRKWRKTENDTMQNAAILFEEGKYLLALPLFENMYNHHPKEEYLKYCYGKCALTRSDKHEMALKLLNEVYEKNKKVGNIKLDLAKANHLNLKFDEALTLIDEYLAEKKIAPEDKAKAIQLKKYCTNGKSFYANPTAAQIKNAGNVINTENDEYVPIISADESILIYTYRGKKSMGGLQNEALLPDPYGFYFEDAYQTIKTDSLWKEPLPIKSINTNSHDAPIALSADGLSLFVYRDSGDDHGDIYLSNNVKGEWSIPQKLKGQINSYAWEGSCSMTADGKQLYFSSERFGGMGGKDIYRATFLPDSTWGNIVNLGDSINTNLDEDAPFIHPDGTTLFYSSQGKNSMGGYDIFQTKLNWTDSTFSNPINLGYPINTPDDDIYYVLSANGETGYYASGKSGGYGLKDIYKVNPGYIGKKPSVFIVKGKIKVDTLPVEATIIVEAINKNNKKFGEFKSSSSNGNYLISLPSGGEFKVTYTYKSLNSKSIEISTANLEGYNEKINNVNFETKTDTTKQVIALNNIPKDTLKVKTETNTVAAIDNKVKEEPKTVVKTEPKIVTPKETKSEKPKTQVVNHTDKFKPNTILQAKIRDYSLKYGDITADSLVFRVQIAAFKYPKNYAYTHLKKLGKVENLLLEDGITRITIGGDFNNLKTAYEHNVKVVMAGQTDAFVTVLHKGKRIYLEDLERLGIFVVK